MQYLEKLSETDRIQFAQYLHDTFAEENDRAYHTDARIPPTTESEMGSVPPVLVRIFCLGFERDCSLKPPAGRTLFSQLIEQILLDGFVSSSEPVLVLQSRSADPKLPQFCGLATFSLGYLTGVARASSLLALLHVIFKSGIDLSTTHPTLHNSCCAIHVHHVEQPSKMHEALKNMKLSARGSIRKMTNVIEITVMVKNLYTHGLNDFALFVRMWNQMSGRAHQIIGKRALTLKLLFESAPPVSNLNEY